MLNFRKEQNKPQNIRPRVLVAALFVLFCFGILIHQLWALQVSRYQGFSERADRNRLTLIPIEPRRGEIMDRNGVVLAKNYRDYTIEIIPSQTKNVKALVEKIAEVIPLSTAEIRRFNRNLPHARRLDRVMLKRGLTEQEAAVFAVRSYEFPGAYLRARWVRAYPQGETAAHIIGYVGRISEQDQAKIEAQGQEGNYRGTDIIGKRGLEASYERLLHGQTGWEEVEVSASGRPVRTISRTDPVPGSDLYLSIDLGLQKLVEGIYRSKKDPHKGALVVIDVKTGGVLAYVSEPSYDPNLFIDGISEENWRRLADDPNHPLIDRPSGSSFPIGSTYKPFVALAMLYYNVRDPSALIPDPGYFELYGQRYRNAGNAVYGPTNLYRALVVSSDTYFFSLGPLIGVDRLHDFEKQFGFGQKTGIDIEGEKKGVLPSKEWKQKAFRRAKDPSDRAWHAGETVSLTVGQGYNSFTMIQLAQATATLARNGQYITPHLVDIIANPKQETAQKLLGKVSHVIDLPASYWKSVQNAMQGVNTRGTAAKAFEGASYTSAGKTGTAQVFSLRGSKYNANTLPKNLRDHALYMGYAPANNPEIAVALIVENGGWGASLAAPIARQVFDYWFSPNHKVTQLENESLDEPLEYVQEESPDVNQVSLKTSDEVVFDEPTEAVQEDEPVVFDNKSFFKDLESKFELSNVPYQSLPKQKTGD
ncbi:penicillin-binding protein 2 [Basilea psittacipulmonis]